MKTYWYLALPFLATLFGLLILRDATAAISADFINSETAVCTTATKILPIGDSITFGDGSENGHGYRQFLFVDLRNAGHDVDLVGPYGDTVATGIDFDHGGNPGKGANFFAPKIINWLNAYQPDVVLLHIGTNDLTGNYTKTTRIEVVLDNIDQYEMDSGTAVPVILAQIINRACQENNTSCQIRSDQTDDLNANLAAMMLTRTDYNNNLTLVNMEDDAGLIYELASAGDFYDNIHPTDAGYQKMAAVWQNSINHLLPTPCNLAPLVVSTPEATADVNFEYTYTVIGSGFPVPTYTLATAPTGMSINTANGEINWTPTSAQAGNHNIVVEISNDEGNINQSYTINVGQPPAFSSIPVTQTLVSQPYSYQVTAGGANPITYSLNLAPQDMIINSNSGLINWTPTITQTGMHDIEIEAHNIDGNTVQTYTLSVLALPEITSSPDIAASANIPYSYAVTADGYPDPTFSLQNPPGGMSIDSESGVLSWLPVEVDAGTHTITITAVNDAGSDQQSYALTVTSPPLITSTPITTTEPDVLYTYDLTAVGSQPITYTMIKGAVGMVLEGSGGQLTWNPSLDNVGTHNVKIQANNAYGTQIQTFSIQVTAAPIITSDPVTEADAEAIYNYPLNVAGSVPMSFTLPIHPQGMTVDASGVISWTPTLADVGNHTVWVRATNDYGTDTQTFNVVVAGAPIINSTPVVIAVVEKPYSYTLDISGVEPLSYALTESPQGMKINRRTGLISWTPSISQAGYHTVTFEVTNTLGLATQSYLLKVRRAPEFTSIPLTDIPVNKKYHYQVIAEGFPEPTFLLLAGPTHMTLDETTGMINWQPSVDQVGEVFTVTISATNEQDTAVQTFSLTVGDPAYEIFVPMLIK